MKTKQLIWLKTEIKTPPLSATARINAGVLLRKLQKGELLSMPDSRPMPSIGSNCHELRIYDGENKKHWRIMYHITNDFIVILDAFSKKTPQTPKTAIERSKKRLQQFQRDIED